MRNWEDLVPRALGARDYRLTVVSAERVGLEFAVHDGPAVAWALRAAPGDTIDATVYGSAFALPDPLPDPLPGHVYLVGDAASVPAVNNLLDALVEAGPEVPATVWLEYAHDDDRDLPLRARAHHTVARVPRKDGGQLLADTICAEVPAGDDGFYWVAAEAKSNRAIVRHLRKTLGIPKNRVSSLAYWSARSS